ncbi:MAG: MOSC domain-containing protein [Planctomycetota bacterium]
MPGTLLAIHLRPGARIPVKKVTVARAVAGHGLDGDHANGGRRQITLHGVEAWRAACAEFGRDIDPAVRRANLLVEGIDLASCIGGAIAFGDVVVEVLGETRPCELMDDDGRLGLQQALRPQHRGGVHGRIVAGGELRVGMACDKRKPLYR